MRKLTLDEKISIKGRLATKKGMNPSTLVSLTMAAAIDLWWRCFGTPVSMHSTPTVWRKQRAPWGYNGRSAR